MELVKSAGYAGCRTIHDVDSAVEHVRLVADQV
jgi:hypothetical protein